jgi:hypothetical protein
MARCASSDDAGSDDAATGEAGSDDAGADDAATDAAGAAPFAIAGEAGGFDMGEAKPPIAVGGLDRSGKEGGLLFFTPGGADRKAGGREKAGGIGGGELLGRGLSGGGCETRLLGGPRLTGSVTRTAWPVGSSMRSEPLSSSASSPPPSSSGRNAVTLISSDEGALGRGPGSEVLGSPARPRRAPGRGAGERPAPAASAPALVPAVPVVPAALGCGLGTRASGGDGVPGGAALRSLPSLTGCAQMIPHGEEKRL